MNTHEIKALLNRFYDGQTSEDEERALQRYFESDEVAPELLEEKNFFNQLFVPGGLEERLSSHIDRLARSEQTVRHARFRWIAGIAASILLLIGVGIYFGNNRSEPFYQDTYSSPEEAYPTAERAISLLAHNVNKGFKHVERIKY